MLFNCIIFIYFIFLMCSPAVVGVQWDVVDALGSGSVSVEMLSTVVRITQTDGVEQFQQLSLIIRLPV